MICGVKAECPIADFQKWKLQTGIVFYTKLNIDSGLISCREYDNHRTYRHTAKLGHYKLTVREVHKNDIEPIYWLTIEGSLHENYFNGQNHSRFLFAHIQWEIHDLCNKLYLKPSNLILRNCEVGVNIKLPYPPLDYIKTAMILFKEKPFVDFEEKNGVCIGIYCKSTEYWIKIYDKGLQFNLKENLMRFEIKYKKMTTLNKYGIRTFADLLNESRVNNLIELLAKAWNNILFYEPGINPSALSLTKHQYELLMQGVNRNYWVQLKKRNKGLFNKRRTAFKSLIKQHRSGTYVDILPLLKNEWERLLVSTIDLTQTSSNWEKGTILPLR
jgi:hypothetical protein